MTSSPAPADFPIPADIEGFWQWDKMHCPRPQTQLTEDLFLRAISVGFSKAMDEFACPVGMQYKVINRYGFGGMIPFDLGSETIEERVERYKDTMGRILPRMGELWEQEWLPPMLPAIEAARNRDYASPNDQELLDTLHEMIEEFTERYVVHGRINFVTMSASVFADFYNDVFAPEDSTEPYSLLQGFPTRSVDAGRGLWALGRRLKASPALSKLFEEAEPSALMLELERSQEGREFLSEFRIYLDEFGWRSDAFELSDPTWRESPVIPLNTLQGYISLGDEADPEARFQQAAELRERLLSQARDRLAVEPEQLAQFNALYDQARHYLNITEDHNFYIDQVGVGVMRLPIMEIGRRLVARGALADDSDVFLLYLDEIREGFSGADHKALVAQRRAELEAQAKVIPPPVIGEPPPPNDDPLGAAFAKMFGVPPEPSRDPDIITGIGASPGTTQGPARVVRNLSEASKVQPGDVLVCEMTMPPWTPLYG